MRYKGQRWRILKEFADGVLALNEDNEKLEVRLFAKLSSIK